MVASPPCQEFSYMAMPWSRAKAIAAEYRAGVRNVKQLTALFDACFRIQREAIEAAGHFIPLVVENVRGAIPWVGRSRWNFGSYHLWGDVPALMPMTKAIQKFNPDGTAHPAGSWFAIANSKKRGWKSQAGGALMRRDDGVKNNGETVSSGAERGKWNGNAFPHELGRDGSRKSFQSESVKNTGGSWFNIGTPGQKETNRNPVHDHIKQSGISGMRENGKGDRWFQDGAATHGSKSTARKAASAAIAKIPFALARHIARTYRPI